MADGAPDPTQAGSLDEFINLLRLLKAWAGNPSITQITQDVRRAWQRAGRPAAELPARATVGYCFRTGRSRPNPDLLLAIVATLVKDDPAVVDQWRASLRVVLAEAEAATQISAAERLPADLADFTGRADLLAAVVDRLDTTGAASPPAILTFAGMAGIGKTALAVRAAHRLRRQGAVDRVLFVNLRGYDPHHPAADPAAVLESFLRRLGVPGDRIPHTLPTRAALYRDVAAGCRALIVLDNAARADQVVPLLPGTPGCPVLVTSRTDLPELPGAQPVRVPVFTPAEAVDLLRRTAGPGRVDADPGTAARMAQLLGYLPLALAVIGSHLRDHVDWTLADYPPVLTAMAMEGGVRAALAVSDASLPDDARLLLRLLALHPGPDTDRYAAAALADTDPVGTGGRLDVLVAANLLQRPSPTRYTLHDLTRAYAAERAALDHPTSRIRQALERLYAQYAHTASAAMDVAYPHETRYRPPPPAATSGPDLAAEHAAVAWLDAEQANLLATARHAAADCPGHTVHQSATLHRHLYTRGAYTDAACLHQTAVERARGTGDRAAEITALNNLGQIHYAQDRYGPASDCHIRALDLARSIADPIGELAALNGLGRTHHAQGRFEQSTDCLTGALELARSIGDPTGELTAVHGLGHIHYVQGRYGPAADCNSRALELARATGNTTGELTALTRLGWTHHAEGRFEQSTDCLTRALDLARSMGDSDGQLGALGALGWTHRARGMHAPATGFHHQALDLARTIGDTNGEASALAGLGFLHAVAGRPLPARDCYQQVLELARTIGDPNLEYEAHQGLGRIHQLLGDPDRALTAHQAALTLATALDQPPDQVRAHDGLAHAHRSLGNPDQARRHWDQALAILTDLGLAAADDVTAADIQATLSQPQG